MNQLVLIVFAILVLAFEKIWAHTFSLEIFHQAVVLGLRESACFPPIGRSVPQIFLTVQAKNVFMGEDNFR